MSKPQPYAPSWRSPRRAATMPLTDSAIKTAKPKEKPYKLSDAQGLYLLVNPNGSK
ncbi:Arm DNA-binding domain-containing protein, partial [Pseudomonas aeruginosa]